MEAIGPAVWAVGLFLWSGWEADEKSRCLGKSENRITRLLICFIVNVVNRFIPSFSSGYYCKAVFGRVFRKP